MTITNLPGGVKTAFTVVAVNDVGPGDEATVIATPLTEGDPTADDTADDTAERDTAVGDASH